MSLIQTVVEIQPNNISLVILARTSLSFEFFFGLTCSCFYLLLQILVNIGNSVCPYMCNQILKSIIGFFLSAIPCNLTIVT